MKVWRFVIQAALLVSGIGGWYFWKRPPEINYRTVSVHRGAVLATINATGTIEPEELVDVGAQVAGRIETLGKDLTTSSKSIDYGSSVEEGTVLARIDDSIYKTQVDQARATFKRSESDLLQLQVKVKQMKEEWGRAQSLLIKKAISDSEHDLAFVNYESAKAALAIGDATIYGARANLKQVEINLAYTTIKSLVNGVIIDRRVNVGQTVVASLNAPSLFLIAKDLKRLQIWASINEADIGQIHPGQPVKFTVDVYRGTTFVGKVGQIRLNATMTQNVVTYTVVVETDNVEGKLLPCMTASVRFEVEERRDVLLVPNAALRWKPRSGTSAFLRFQWQVKPQRSDVVTEGDNSGFGNGWLWVFDKQSVRPVFVKAGLSDGTATSYRFKLQANSENRDKGNSS
jgi:HlyD family secretion protein